MPASLSVINQEKEDFIIFSDRKSVITFFSNMYPYQHFFLDETPLSSNMVNRIGRLRSYIHMTYGVYKRKKQIKKIFDNLNIEKIYFFHEGFCQSSNWLMLRLHKRQRSQAYYIPIERSFDYKNQESWDRARSLKYYLYELYDYIVWGYLCYYCHYNTRVLPIMTASYFKRIDCKEMKIEISNEGIISKINEQLLDEKNYPSKSIMLLENSLRGGNIRFSERSYEIFIDKFITVIGNEHIFFKGHPDMVQKYGKEKELGEIPSYIPGNLILNRFSCVIGALSDMLFEAANVGTLSISTLYLFDVNESDRELYVNYLKNRNNSIMFPKSFEELIDFLRGDSEKEK